jgi:hypothetical protein
MIKMITTDEGHQIWYDSSRREWVDTSFWRDLFWHRIDGPACIWANGKYNEWWVLDVRCKNFKEFQYASGLSDDQMCILRLKYGEI